MKYTAYLLFNILDCYFLGLYRKTKRNRLNASRLNNLVYVQSNANFWIKKGGEKDCGVERVS